MRTRTFVAFFCLVSVLSSRVAFAADGAAGEVAPRSEDTFTVEEGAYRASAGVASGAGAALGVVVGAGLGLGVSTVLGMLPIDAHTSSALSFVGLTAIGVGTLGGAALGGAIVSSFFTDVPGALLVGTASSVGALAGGVIGTLPGLALMAGGFAMAYATGGSWNGLGYAILGLFGGIVVGGIGGGVGTVVGAGLGGGLTAPMVATLDVE